MDRIEDLAALKRLLSAQLRPGVCTNAFASPEEYAREIAAGTLWTEEWDGGLLLLRDRGAYQRLNFCLHGAQTLPRLEKKTVVELPARAKDRAMSEAAGLFCRQGFCELFRRARLARPAGLAAERGSGVFAVRAAGPGDLDGVRALLAECFDPVAGCLPTEGELRELLSRGGVIVSEDGGALAGLLHIGRGRSGSELRHLGVSAKYRRAGAAQAMMPLYMEMTDHAKSVVWVRQGNVPAERFYEKNGYAPDGWTSTVLVYDA